MSNTRTGLELPRGVVSTDDGMQTRMTSSDIAIQGGTRHAWLDKSGCATTMAFVPIGAFRR